MLSTAEVQHYALTLARDTRARFFVLSFGAKMNRGGLALEIQPLGTSGESQMIWKWRITATDLVRDLRKVSTLDNGRIYEESDLERMANKWKIACL